MSATDRHKAEARLTLSSRLAALRLVWPWVDALAEEHSIPADTLFAIHLCLEEALSNVIRHGYRDEPDRCIVVRFAVDGAHGFTFTIEDTAPHFMPEDFTGQVEAKSPVSSLDELELGGQGIPLMRRFATTLRWEQLPDGNRLTLTFPAAANHP